MIEIDPKNKLGYFGRGNGKVALGDFQGAITDWQKMIELDPDHKAELQSLIDNAKKKIK